MLRETYVQGPTRGSWTLVDLAEVGNVDVGLSGDIYHDYRAASSRKKLDEESDELDVFTLDAEVGAPTPSVVRRLPTIRSVVQPRGMSFGGSENGPGGIWSELEIGFEFEGEDPIEWV